MIVVTGGWVTGIIGIFLGNSLWLVGLIVLGIGIWGLKVEKESIQKAVGMMSLATGGEPKGLALKLKGLIEPEDRTDEFGKRMLVIGVILLIVGCSFIRGCVG